MIRWSVIAVASVTLFQNVAAQSSPAPGRVLGAGYSAPAPLKAAPGQVITLFVHSPNGTQPGKGESAEGIPLPVLLNGYSVALEQALYPEPVAVPLFAVYPVDNCYGLILSVCVKLTAITIQIPWELIPNRPRSGRPENFAILTVSYNGVKGEALPVQPEVDSIHVISSCDSTMPPGIERPEDMAGACTPLVAHLNGRLVNSANPAAVGETVVLYAFGLGNTGDEVRTGDGVQSPVPITDIALAFEVGVNMMPNRPVARQSPSQSLVPVFAGLTPGQVGLYQIAFAVPPLPEGTPACTASTIASNLTISIGRQQSFDGAGICVQP